MSDAFDDDIAACADAVSRGDPSRFRATMAAPAAARAVLFPVYAFNLEVARAPWVTNEPMIAEMRMQWWRDALDEIATGATVRRHMVATPLSRILDAEGIDYENCVGSWRVICSPMLPLETAPPSSGLWYLRFGLDFRSPRVRSADADGWGPGNARST